VSINPPDLSPSALQGFVGLESAQTPYACLSLALDNLSLITEALGRDGTEKLLETAKTRIQELMDRAEILDFGHGAFAAQIPNAGRAEIEEMTQALLDSFTHTPFATELGAVHMNVTIGCALFPEHNRSFPQLMIFAEEARLDAYRQGPNTLAHYYPSDTRRQKAVKQLQISEDVQQALLSGNLALAYQPVVEAQTQIPLFYEVLVRIKRPDGSLIQAGDFIPVIEDLRLTKRIDRHILELALRDLETFPDIKLAVNLSALTAADPSFRSYIESRFAGRPDLACRTILEITETAEIIDLSEIAKLVTIWKGMGGRVALDDFGAGFTSFRHLQVLSIEVLKIDGQLIRNITNKPEQQIIIRTLAAMARGLGLTIVGECVETAEEARWLLQEGVVIQQGYLYGRPTLERPWVQAATRAATRTAPTSAEIEDAKADEKIIQLFASLQQDF
jgi:EAL domain-containing protein (putative c-di-GMP-specific phosphodiesterase class I)/GGDEF domain-containing protein